MRTTWDADGRHRRVLELAVPAMGALLADPVLGLVDTAVVGRIGATQLAALGLGVAVLATVSWVFNFLVYGTTAAVARGVGACDEELVGRRIAHAGWAAIGLGAGVGFLVLFAARPLLELMGAVDEIIPPATTYLRIRAVGIVGLLVGYVGHGAFRGLSDTRTPLVVAVCANVVNGLLDVVLVFGFGMGLAGAAWATVAAELITAAAFVVLLRGRGLPLTGHGRPTLAELAELAAVSRDLFIRTGALVGGLLAVTAAAARIGTVTTAAHQVLWQVWVLVSFLMDGFAIAAQAMVGTALGAGDAERARADTRVLLVWGVGGGVVTAGLLLATVGVIPGVLTDEPEVIAAVGGTWLLAMAPHALNGVVFVLDGVFMGAGDFAYLRTWTLVAAVVAAGLGQLVPALGWGLTGLWVAIDAMMLVRFGALLARSRSDAWLRTGATA